MSSPMDTACRPGGLRPYQEKALGRLDAGWDEGRRRAWVVLPPGAGKTLVGLEAARRLGRKTVVFVPNTAIQNQWAEHWRRFGGTAGTSRELDTEVSVLTYQSLAVFDADAETDEEGHERTLLRRLHDNGHELTTDLLKPGFATTGFLTWLDLRLVRPETSAGEPIGWDTIARSEPLIAAAALRFHHARLLDLPQGARLREEHRHAPSAQGERLRCLVLCDHERAGAALPARLRDVLDAEAGSAWLMLENLVADPRTRPLNPVLVTGRTVAAGEDTARGLVESVASEHPGLCVEPAGAGIARITGPWTSRTWVRAVTSFFEQGRCQVLVGTRALLGEGWDARGVNALIDLATSTTPTSVVQTRGRAVRLDPAWPEKAANTWTVVCVTDRHPKGAADWDRFVRKHEGYLVATPDGEIMSGVAHVDAAFSPHAPPAVDALDATNAAMLVRAQDRAATRAAWRLGEPFRDELVHTLRVRPARTERAVAAAADVRPQAPAVVPAENCATPTPSWWSGGPAVHRRAGPVHHEVRLRGGGRARRLRALAPRRAYGCTPSRTARTASRSQASTRRPPSGSPSPSTRSCPRSPHLAISSRAISSRAMSYGPRPEHGPAANGHARGCAGRHGRTASSTTPDRLGLNG